MHALDSNKFYTFNEILSLRRKLKLYEEQELTMQVFSEPDHISNSDAPGHLDHRSSLEQVHHGQSVDNTYATIQPRNNQNRLTAGSGSNGGGGSISMRSGGAGSAGGIGGAGLLLTRVDPHVNDFADYATLRNNRAPSVSRRTAAHMLHAWQ